MGIILNTLGIVLSVSGTVFSLRTVLTTRTKEAGTYNELANRHNSFMKEKRCVMLGLILIILGGGLQIVSQFIN